MLIAPNLILKWFNYQLNTLKLTVFGFIILALQKAVLSNARF